MEYKPLYNLRRVYKIEKKFEEGLPEFLVMLLKHGLDPFERLWEMCESMILSSIWKYYLSGYEDEDIRQEAGKVLVESIYRYELRKEGMKFLEYYDLSLRNHMGSLVRKDNTQTRKINKNTASLDSLVEEAGPNIMGTSSVTSYPEDATLMKELLTNFLVELSPFEEKVFFSYLKGNSPDEITEELGSESGKVKNAMYRCSAKLKSLMY